MPDAHSTDQDATAAELLKQVGMNLRALRERRRLTQDHVAHIAGLATRHLQKIEAGQVNVTLRTLARLGVALNVDVSEFVCGRRDEEDR